MIKHNRFRLFLALTLAIILLIVLISACDAIGFGGGEPPRREPARQGILAPKPGTRVIAGANVQIQSAHGGDISRVELHVQAPGEAAPKLLRADAPDNGVVVQEWMPDQAGVYQVKVIAYDANNTPSETEAVQIEAIKSTAISLTPVPRDQSTVVAERFEPPITSTVAAAGTVIGATPAPTIPAAGTAVGPAAVATATSEPPPAVTIVPVPKTVNVVEPTPVPHYPPPPPAPGVPPGPTQDQIPEMMPPVADAATLLGVYTSNNTQRILISELDDIPAKTVGGTTVFRGWRVQNTGTATWGPGYELAFYGGRAMGSGGVAFESTFPGEPARRNTIINSNRLVVPEGKPNQVAILEVLLNAPVTPGIHQSYWRMRNPHGVYFGPIMGVTMEVIRECSFGTPNNPVYGAPVINRFEILGVGSVYQPENPVTVVAEFGDNVTLDWDIVNAENFDIVIRKPTGDAETISTSDQNGRVTFPVNELGDYTVTLYADNGSCTVSAEVIVTVFPPEDEQFRLIIIHSGGTGAASSAKNTLTRSDIPPSSIVAEWQHFDQEANEFDLFAALYEEKETQTCLFNWEYACYTSREWVQIGQPVKLPVGSDAQGAVTVDNLVASLCNQLSRPSNGPIPNNEIHYLMQARKNGQAANPQLSNGGQPVIIQQQCNSVLPTEIQGAFNTP